MKEDGRRQGVEVGKAERETAVLTGAAEVAVAVRTSTE